MAANETTVTVTVTFSDSGTTPQVSTQKIESGPSLVLDPGLEVSRPISYYGGYKGYQADFLTHRVALPALTEEQRRNAAKDSTADAGADPTVLRYTHFSLVMDRRRQMALYTAVNIDGSALRNLPRGKDKWFYDSRIAESEQIGEHLYKSNALDRGHLVRRLDPVWGNDAGRANDDTFHFTNCSPQHAKFNQGGDLWQGLENYILNKADAQGRKVTVFTGPVLGEDDPLYKGVRLPLAFWKIIAYVKADGRLVTAAYVLEQGSFIDDMLGFEKAFEPGAFRVLISHLVERTGLDLGYLAQHELELSRDGYELAPADGAAPTDRVPLGSNYANLVL